MEHGKTPKIRFHGFSDNWEVRKLGDFICDTGVRTSNFDEFPLYSLTIENGVTPKTQRYERGFLITKEEDFFKIVEPKNFVTNPMNLRFGAVGYNRENFSISVSGYYDVFEIDNNQSSGFWNAYFKTEQILQKFDNAAIGSLIEKRRVHYSELKKIELSVPVSQNERMLIGEYFSRLDDLINLYKRKLEKSLNFKKAMLAKMFPQNGKPTPQIRFAGFNDNWEVRKLREVAEIFAGGDIDKDKVVAKGKYPIYANALTDDGIIGYYDNYYKIEAPAVTVTGRGDVGYAQVRTKNFTPVVRLLTVCSNMDCYFLANSINNHSVIVESTGVPQLTVPQLSSYDIQLPTPAEQERIGQYFSRLDDLINLYKRKLKKSLNLKKAMLEKMFP